MIRTRASDEHSGHCSVFRKVSYQQDGALEGAELAPGNMRTLNELRKRPLTRDRFPSYLPVFNREEKGFQQEREISQKRRRRRSIWHDDRPSPPLVGQHQGHSIVWQRHWLGETFQNEWVRC